MDVNKVPERIKDIQTCYFWPCRCEPDAQLRPLMREDQLLMVVSPHACPKLIVDFRQAGGLVLLYISTYKAPNIKEVPDNFNLQQWETGSPDYTSLQDNPFYQAVNLEGHPDWILYEKDGQPRRPFDDPGYMTGWYQTTALAADYAKAAVRGVRAVAADPRFDGIFYDNFHPTNEPSQILKNGKLETANMEDHQKHFYELAGSIRKAGDEVSDEHFWILINNGGNLYEDTTSQEIADFIEIEAFVYGWDHPGSTMNDEEATQKLTANTIIKERGGKVVPMPYFGFSGSDIAEDARRMKRLTDKTNAVFSDMFTLARPRIISSFAHKNWKQSWANVELQKKKGLREEDLPAYQAFKNEVPGDLEAAKEIYLA